jgi:hypothetical protein
MTPRTAIAALLTLFLLAHTFAPRSIHAAGRAPRVGPAPDWVLKIDPPPAGAQSSQFVATYCLLMDEQHDLATACGFYHFAVLLLNHQGIQDASDISVRYDPSYQSLTFHSVRIHRGSRIIDKLETDAIRTFQRETNLERSMYDGSLTASINLSDVRVGDIIEYSYSRCGQHPAYAEHRFGGFGLETFFAAELYSLRLRVPDEMHVTFREQGTSVKPEVSREAGLTTYRWNQQQVQAMELEDNVPRWYLMTPSIRFSDFANWTEVAHWAIPLFEVTGAERDRLHALAQDSIAAADLPARVLETIRFVQNEIRYLALEEGLSAYRPHPPTQVWETALWRLQGQGAAAECAAVRPRIEAHPMLVNSGGIRSEDKCILAPADFDHCIVTFRMDGQRYFVDPTDSHQGGDLQHLSVGDFRYGLIIAPFTNGLTALPEFDPGKVLATERFYLDSSGGAKLVVSTEYWGPQADLQRFLFATNDLAGIQKSYVAYYAQVYPTIEPTTSIVYHDDRRDTDNMFLIEEAYRIPDIWTPEEEDTTIHHLELMPIEFKSLASWDKAPAARRHSASFVFIAAMNHRAGTADWIHRAPRCFDFRRFVRVREENSGRERRGGHRS